MPKTPTFFQGFIACWVCLTLCACGGGGEGNQSINVPAVQETMLPSVSSFKGIVSTFAGVDSHLQVDGPITSATFTGVYSMTAVGKYLYFVDLEFNSLRKIDIDAGIVSTLAGDPYEFDYRDGVGSAAHFMSPIALAYDNGYFYVAEQQGNRIRRVDITTGETITFAGSGVVGSSDGSSVNATFDHPSGLAVVGRNLYVAQSPYIRRINIDTGEVTTVAGSGSQASGDGVGRLADVSPFALTTDGRDIYFTDRNRTVRKFEVATSTVTTLAGTGRGGEIDGFGRQAGFRDVVGLTYHEGSLYVAGGAGNTIRRLVIETGEVSTLAGQAGVEGYRDASGADALFETPVGIGTDGRRLFVSENRRFGKIRVID
jgi:hypothetical protein